MGMSCFRIMTEICSLFQVKESLFNLGLPIAQGALSTILGVLVLAFAPSYIFLSFFKTAFLVISFGAFHGLFLLPVLLSLFGPGSFRCPKKKIKINTRNESKNASSGFEASAIGGYENQAFEMQELPSVHSSDAAPYPTPSVAYSQAVEVDLQSSITTNTVDTGTQTQKEGDEFMLDESLYPRYDLVPPRFSPYRGFGPPFLSRPCRGVRPAHFSTYPNYYSNSWRYYSGSEFNPRGIDYDNMIFPSPEYPYTDDPFSHR